MEGQKCFAVVGGDARQAAAARALARAGYSVGGPEVIAVADYILLPLPLDAARTPLAELLRAARPGTLALGGMLSVEAKAIAAEAGVELVDYFAREELTIRNAIPTAEGCIGILMKERSRTLWGSSILLTGFGPVGQALGVRLGASGENIARLYQRKHYYFVPYGQDDPNAKPQSLKARFELLPQTLEAALEGRQLQPVLQCPCG